MKFQKIENKETFLQNVINHAPRYLGGSLIGSGVGLLMTKYYTSVFTPTEFGILSLYAVMFQYIMLIVSLNMTSGATRLYFDYRENKRDEYLSTIFWFTIATSIITFAIGLILMPFIVSLISAHSEFLYIVTIILGITAVFVSFFTSILYNEKLSKSVFKNNIIQTVSNHLISIVFIAIFPFGILGRQIGQCSGYLANLLALIRELGKKKLFQLKCAFNLLMLKETFSLSLPSFITSLLGIVFIYLDRIFLKYFYGNKEVGIYSLGFILGQGLSMIYEAISLSLFPKTMEDLKEDYKNNIVKLEKFAYQYYFGLIFITLILVLSSKWLVMLFSTKEYFEASRVLPFVMVGFMMGGFYKIPSLVLGYHKIVWFYPFLAFFSFGANGFLNYLLIPKYEMIGAAFATFAGLFIYSSVVQGMTMKFNTKRYNIITASIYILIFAAISVSFYKII